MVQDSSVVNSEKLKNKTHTLILLSNGNTPSFSLPFMCVQEKKKKKKNFPSSIFPRITLSLNSAPGLKESQRNAWPQ